MHDTYRRRIRHNFPAQSNAYLTYNGAPARDEDPADYVKFGPVKAVRLA